MQKFILSYKIQAFLTSYILLLTSSYYHLKLSLYTYVLVKILLKRHIHNITLRLFYIVYFYDHHGIG
jgi:hypothetical protein